MTTSIRNQLSTPLVAFAAGTYVVGAVLGVFVFANRSSVREQHHAATAAWPQHAIIAAVAAIVLGVAVARHRRRARGTLLLLAPVGRTAALRVRATLTHGAWRAPITLLLLAFLAYSGGRAGVQLTGGFDPNFTANAWGGPSYLGAMACHYLDGSVMVAAAAMLLHYVVLLRAPAISRTPAAAHPAGI